MKTFDQRFEDGFQPVPEAGCWLWIKAASSAGYGQIYKDGKLEYAHRLSYQSHYGDILEGMFICHKCDTPACINPDHLFAGYHSDNMRDMREKDRSNKGERNPMNKLSAEDVLLIKNDDRTTVAIAEEYGVCRHTVGDIKLGKLWGWL